MRAMFRRRSVRIGTGLVAFGLLGGIGTVVAVQYLSGGSACPPTYAYSQRTGGAADNISKIIVVVACGTHRRQLVPFEAQSYSDPVLSPDGSTLAFVASLQGTLDIAGQISPGANEVYTEQLATQDMRRLSYLGTVLTHGDGTTPFVTGSAGSLAYDQTGHHIIFGFATNMSDVDVTPQQAAIVEKLTGIYIASTDRPLRAGQIAPVVISNQGINELSLSPDGKRLLAVTSTNQVKVYDSSTGALTESATLPGHLLGGFFSPDGRYTLLVYAPPIQSPAPLSNPTPQLWARSMKTGKMIQLSHVSGGLIAAAMTNNWVVYYRSTIADPAHKPSTTIHSLNLITGTDACLATVPGDSTDITVQVGGQVTAGPKILRKL